MTYTEIDPAVVRTIAEAALHGTISDDRDERVEAALIASGVAGPVLSEEFDAWSKAVGTEYERLEAAAGADVPAMSDDRLAELLGRMKRHALSNAEADELAVEVERLRERESALVDEVDAVTEKGRRTGAELARCADLNLDLMATNTNQAEMLKEAREQIRDARLAETGEPELEWGVRTTSRSTGRTEDFEQPSEVSARSRVARSLGDSMLICRTKAGKWRVAEKEGS